MNLKCTRLILWATRVKFGLCHKFYNLRWPASMPHSFHYLHPCGYQCCCTSHLFPSNCSHICTYMFSPFPSLFSLSYNRVFPINFLRTQHSLQYNYGLLYSCNSHFSLSLSLYNWPYLHTYMLHCLDQGSQ